MLQRFDERNRNILININGQLVPRDEAGISPFDSAVQGGDAVWEGLRLYTGRIFRLREHLARLRGSALALAFTEVPTDDELIEQIKRTLDANGSRIACKSVSAGERGRPSERKPRGYLQLGSTLERRSIVSVWTWGKVEWRPFVRSATQLR